MPENMIIIVGAIVFACIALAGIIFAKKYVNLPQWVQLAAMLVVVAGMFVFVWYTHKAAQKQEAVFMGICWDSYGTVHYPPNGVGNANCEEAAPLNWKKIPKTVGWLLPADFDEYRRSFDEALKFWNNALGGAVVVTTSDAEAADILVVAGSASDSGAMSTSHQRVAGDIKATITVKKPGNIRLFMLQLEHELGHAMFGLAHDRGQSIMNPRAGAGEEEQMKIWMVTDKDKKAIKRTLE